MDSDEDHIGRHNRSRSKDKRKEKTTAEVKVKQESTDSSTNLIKELIAQQAQQTMEQTKLLTNAIHSLTQASSAAAQTSGQAARPLTRNYGCNFCGDLEHHMRDCLVLMRYLVDGKATRDANGKIATPSGIPIPPGNKGQPLQARLDLWLAANPMTRANASSTVPNASITHIDSNSTAVHFFEAEMEPDLSVETLQYEIGNETEGELTALMESLINEAKKTLRGRKAKDSTGSTNTTNLGNDIPVAPSQNSTASDAPPATTAIRSTPSSFPGAAVPHSTAPGVPARPSRPKFVSQADDPALQEEVIRLVLNNKLEGGNITLKHLLAISPSIRAKLSEFLRVHRVDPTTAAQSSQPSLHFADETTGRRRMVVSEDAVALREVQCHIGGVANEYAILDEGSSVVVIREDLWLETGLPIQRDRSMRMEGAHGDVASTLGAIVDLPIQLDKVVFYVQAQVVPKAPFRALLGRPFFTLAQSTIENRPDEQTWLTVRNPNPPHEVLTIPTIPRRPRCNHRHTQSHYFQMG